MVALIFYSAINLLLGRLSKRISKTLILIFLLFYSLFIDSKVILFLISISSAIIYFFDDPKIHSIILILIYTTYEALIEDNIVLLFIYFEIVSLISLFFILERKSLEACLYYSLVIIFSSLLMIIGLGFYFSGNFPLFKIFFTVGFLSKSSILPFLFLPFIYSRVSSKRIALFTLSTFSFFIIFFKFVSLFKISRELILLFAISSSILSSIMSTVENNVKKIMAYSSIIEYSILLSIRDFWTFFFFLRYYVISKILFFIPISKIIREFGPKVNKIILGEHKISSFFIAYSIILFLGFPPLLGFFSKLFAAISLKILFLPYLISSSIYSFPILRILEKSVLSKRKNVEEFSPDFIVLGGIFLISIVQTIEACMKLL